MAANLVPDSVPAAIHSPYPASALTELTILNMKFTTYLRLILCKLKASTVKLEDLLPLWWRGLLIRNWRGFYRSRGFSLVEH